MKESYNKKRRGKKSKKPEQEKWMVLGFRSAREYDGWKFMNKADHDILDELSLGDCNGEYL